VVLLLALNLIYKQVRKYGLKGVGTYDLGQVGGEKLFLGVDVDGLVFIDFTEGD
jgi:hypothetical protein